MDTISFTDASGVTRPLKDLREPPDYQIRGTVRKNAQEPLDFTAQRDDVYGPDHEGDAYLLWEANRVAIIECLFDPTQVTTLQVPYPL